MNGYVTHHAKQTVLNIDNNKEVKDNASHQDKQT
jgi:hypothetical protein